MGKITLKAEYLCDWWRQEAWFTASTEYSTHSLALCHPGLDLERAGARRTRTWRAVAVFEAGSGMGTWEEERGAKWKTR
jgi:hypothetical protein